MEHLIYLSNVQVEDKQLPEVVPPITVVAGSWAGRGGSGHPGSVLCTRRLVSRLGFEPRTRGLKVCPAAVHGGFLRHLV